MSPFSICIAEFRRIRCIRQKELAQRMGYEQSYISALEIGSKGPPTKEFIKKLADVLCLNEEEAARFMNAAAISERKILIPADADARVFELFHEMRERIHHLLPCQMKLMLEVLRMPEKIRHEIGILGPANGGKAVNALKTKKEAHKM